MAWQKYYNKASFNATQLHAKIVSVLGVNVNEIILRFWPPPSSLPTGWTEASMNILVESSLTLTPAQESLVDSAVLNHVPVNYKEAHEYKTEFLNPETNIQRKVQIARIILEIDPPEVQ